MLSLLFATNNFYESVALESFLTLPIVLLLGYLLQLKFFEKAKWYILAALYVVSCIVYYTIDVRYVYGVPEQYVSHGAPILGNYVVGVVFTVLTLAVIVLCVLLGRNKDTKKQLSFLKLFAIVSLITNILYLSTYAYMFGVAIIAIVLVTAYFAVLLMNLNEKHITKMQNILLPVLLGLTIVGIWLFLQTHGLAFWTGRRANEYLFEVFMCYSGVLTCSVLFFSQKKLKVENTVKDLSAQLLDIQQQLENGALTQEEYEQQKSEILSKI